MGLAFLFLLAKNAENDYFDQRLGCATPKRWSKYSRLKDISDKGQLVYDYKHRKCTIHVCGLVKKFVIKDESLYDNNFCTEWDSVYTFLQNSNIITLSVD